MIFSIMVDAAIQEVLAYVCGPQESHHRVGCEAGKINLFLYADGGRIAGRDPDWVQEALETMVDMFIQVVLKMNLDKTKAMVCTLGFIWGKIREAAYKRRETGRRRCFRRGKVHGYVAQNVVQQWWICQYDTT